LWAAFYDFYSLKNKDFNFLLLLVPPFVPPSQCARDVEMMRGALIDNSPARNHRNFQLRLAATNDALGSHSLRASLHSIIMASRFPQLIITA
jgi:hypothetical protein